eukprot:m.215966 g.215966  ORF g.215966 m.215966 type:complete len:191 (+) comp15105_c1_seq78:5288-5860(+)
MNFHSIPLPQFDFDDFTTTSSVANAVGSFVYPTDRSYGTATGAALNYISNNLLDTTAGWREGRTVVYFITDGVSQEDAATVQNAADLIHSFGVEVIAIGISDAVDATQLGVIAGANGEVIVVPDFENLDDSITNELLSVTCSGTTTDTTTAADTTVGAATCTPYVCNCPAGSTEQIVLNGSGCEECRCIR